MIVPLVAAGLGLLTHLGGQEVRRFETRAAESVLTRVSGSGAKARVRTTFASLIGGPLGELDRVTIEVSGFACPELPFFTESSRSKRGRIRELNLVLTDFRLAGLRIDRLEATIPDCRFDYSAAVGNRGFHLSRSGEGVATVWISQEALTEYARGKFPIFESLQVKVDKDKVYVEGTAAFLFKPAEFWLVSALRVDGGSRLALVAPRFILDGRRTDLKSVPLLGALGGSLIDLDKDLGLHGAMQIERIRLRDGVVLAGGPFHLPVHPAEGAVAYRR